MKKFLALAILWSVFCNAQEEDDLMFEQKSAKIEDLVARAVSYFQKPDVSIGKACAEFRNNKKWRIGEISVFIFGGGGECYLADPLSKIWQDFYDEKNTLSESFIRNLLKAGEGNKGSWTLFSWNNDTMHSFVKVVKKRGKNYIVGAGFFPESAKHRAHQLVTNALIYLKDHGSHDLFSRINNPYGAFVKGDVYLWVYDLEGNVLAHGANQAMVGQNLKDWQDSDGKYRNREMIKLAQSPERSGWIDYKERGMLKRAFIQAVEDPATKKTYIIGGGYYPGLDDESVKNFVKKAINYLKANGKKAALTEFSNQTGDFVPGPLRIFVYDPDGTMLADSENPGFVGQNLLNARDPEGKPITKRLIDQAQESGKAWISFLDRNAYKDAYVEKVSVPDGDFIVGSGYWPASKQRSVKSMVDKGLHFANSHPMEEALASFTNGDSEFLRGDSFLFVYDSQNYCWAYGPYHHKIWQPVSAIIDVKDTQGRPVFESIKATAQTGGGWVEFKFNNAICRMYIREFEKTLTVSPQERAAAEVPKVVRQKNLVFTQEPAEIEIERFIIGSSYYL